MTEGDELLTVDEVAERVKVNPETVRRWIKSGRLPAARPAGGPYRIHSSDLDRLFGALPKAEAPSPPDISAEERPGEGTTSTTTVGKSLTIQWNVLASQVVRLVQDRRESGVDETDIVREVAQFLQDRVLAA